MTAAMLRREAHRTWTEQMAVWMASVSALTLGVVALIGVWGLVWPFDPVTHLTLTVDGPAHVGREAIVLLDYCKVSDLVPHEVRWSLVNEIMISIDGPRTALPVGCESARPVTLALSPHIAPGRYRLQLVVMYEPVPWRTIAYVRTSPPFEIQP